MTDKPVVLTGIREEEQVREKWDNHGNRWEKVYCGGGDHFKNWLQQYEEIYGKENISIEKANPSGFKCFEEGEEVMYRIWVRRD
jgi:hypothetical protein